MAAVAGGSGLAKGIFVILALGCLAPILPLRAEVAGLIAPAALVAGAVLGLTLTNPFSGQSKRVSRNLLQASVVLLGFSMDLAKVLSAGRDELIFSFVSITGVFAVGWLLQRWLRIRPVTSLLVSAGTAICGGSAIAAISTVMDAKEEDVSVAVGTIFLLNAIALLTFPLLGHALSLSQTQFGIWAGIAIHDVASVVGAGNAYGPIALDTATAVKLSRVLYLVPITLILAFMHHRNHRTEGESSSRAVPIPWFVGLFLLASLSRLWLPIVVEQGPVIKRIASAGFSLSLFLIGASLTRNTLKAVGVRPLIQGVILWLLISVAALMAVRVK